MIFSKLFWNTRLGGDLSLARRRDRGPASIAGGCGGVGQRPLVADKTIQIFVCGGANQTHVMQIKRSAPLADLNTVAQRFGYGVGADRLCFLGGAPLPRDDRLTLAECGLHANSSLHVLGRLRGGVEVPLFGQEHSISDTGLLDLKGKDVGPAKLKEVATFFSSTESSAVRRLVLSDNMITGRGENLSGLKAVCEVLSTLKHPISLDLANCGLGVAEVNELAQAISAGAALNSLKCANNPGMVGGLWSYGTLKAPDVHVEVFKQLIDGLKTSQVTEVDFSSCGIGPVALGHLSDWVREATAALNEVNVAFNQIGSEGGIALRDALKTSNLKFLAIGKMYTSAGGTVITGSQLTTGVTLFAGGRQGELAEGPDSHLNVKLKWTDTGKMSSWMKLYSLDGEPLKLPLQSPFEGEHLDLAHQQLDPGYVLLLSWWLTTEFSAAVTRLILDENPLTGGTWRDVDKDITGVTSLFDTLKTSSVTELGLANCRLGPGSLGKLAEYVRDAEAAIARLSLSGNKLGCGALVKDYLKTVGLDAWYQYFERHLPSNLETIQRVRATTNTDLQRMASEANMRLDAKTTQQVLDALKKEPKVGTQADLSGPKELFGVLSTLKSLISLDLSDCGLGVAEVNELARAIQAGVTLISINCLANSFGEEVLATLLTAIEGTSVRTLCGLTEGQTIADFSRQNLGPIDMKIMAAEYRFQGFIAAINSLALGSNSIGDEAMIQLLDVLKDVSLTSFDISNTKCGVSTATKLAEIMAEKTKFKAAVEAIAIGANPITSEGGAILLETIKTSKLKTIDIGKPLPLHEPYESDTLDLSNTQMHPGHVLLLSWWLGTKFSAAVEVIAIGANPITSEGGAALLETIKTSNLKTIDIGKPLPLQEPYESDTLDLSNTQMDPGHVLLLSWWLGTEFSAAVARLILDENPLTGGDRRDVDKDITGVTSLFDSLKTSSITELGLAKCRLGPGSLSKLAEYIRDAEAAVDEVNVSMNPIGVDGAKALAEVLPDSSLKCLILGPKSTRLPVNDAEVTELDFEGQDFTPAEVTLVAAATSTMALIADINLSEAKIGEARFALIEAMKSSSTLQSITIGKCVNLPLKRQYELDTLDVCDKDIEFGGATVIGWWLSSAMADPLRVLALSSTGDSSKPYKLTTNIEDKICLEPINASVGDGAVIGEWCRKDCARWVESPVLPDGQCSVVYEGKTGTAAGYNVIHGGITLEEVCAWLKTSDASAHKLKTTFEPHGKMAAFLHEGNYAKVTGGASDLATTSHFLINQPQLERLRATLNLLHDGLLWDKARLQEIDYDAWLADLEMAEVSVQKLKEHEITKALPDLVPQHWKLERERDSYKSEFEMEDEQYERLLEKLAKTAEEVTIRHDKVTWDDDRSESDWLSYDQLENKQRLSPLEVAVKRSAPVQSLEYLAAQTSKGLEAKNSNGLSFHDWLLGYPDYHEFAQTFRTFRPTKQKKMHYKIIGTKVHGSKTCLVIFGIHIETGERVALKLMTNREEWIREQDMRTMVGGEQLDERHVLKILDAFELDDAGLAFCQQHPELKGDHRGFLLTLPAAERDLSDALSHDRIAGHELGDAVSILRQVAEHLLYLHSVCKRIHGDLKSRNIVKIVSSDGNTYWVLIDLDATCAIGSAAGQKITSSAFFPPEMARYKREGDDVEAPHASVRFEMFYFGLLIYQMCTPDAETIWRTNQADNMVNWEEDSCRLAYHFETMKLNVCSRIMLCGGEWSAAADLCLWCLQSCPDRRPESMEDVLQHRLFKPGGKLRYFESGIETMDAFVHQQAKALTTLIGAGNTGGVEELFDRGGVHLMLIDRTIGGSTITPLMRAAFVGEVTTVEILLNEIEDSWPVQVRKEYLDQRTSLGLTAYMIACARSHGKVSQQLKDKGSSTNLVNAFGQTGDDLLQIAREDHESSTLAPLHRTYESLEAYLALLDRKAIVMSCPEKGSLDPNGGEPYDQPVMDKINELRQRGRLKGGFDRAGSSNQDPRDDETWPQIFKTAGLEHLFETDGEKRKEMIKSTYWFTGYRTAAKAQMNLECQTFDGTLEIICIKGGPITDVEHEEMDRIIEEARRDAATNEIRTNIQLKKVSYYEFLREYDPESLRSKNSERVQPDPQENPRAAGGDVLDVDEGASPTIHTHEASPAAKIAQLEQALAQLEQTLAAERAAKDEELQQLRAQLERLEGVPPPRTSC